MLSPFLLLLVDGTAVGASAAAAGAHCPLGAGQRPQLEREPHRLGASPRPFAGTWGCVGVLLVET